MKQGSSDERAAGGLLGASEIATMTRLRKTQRTGLPAPSGRAVAAKLHCAAPSCKSGAATAVPLAVIAAFCATPLACVPASGGSGAGTAGAVSGGQGGDVASGGATGGTIATSTGGTSSGGSTSVSTGGNATSGTGGGGFSSGGAAGRGSGGGGGAGGKQTGGAGAGGKQTGGGGAAGSGSCLLPSGSFKHPGGFHTQVDIDRIKAAIAAHTEPQFGAWTAFQKSAPSPTRQPNPQSTLTEADNSASLYAVQNDGHAAYQLAVYWMLSGNDAYAAGAAATLRAWAAKLTPTAAPSATLRTGLGMTQMVNAAEILRHANGGYSGFTPADIAAFTRILRTAIYPILHSAWPRSGYGDSGWGTPCVAAMMSAAIFTEDCAWLAEAMNEFKGGECHSVMTQAINDGSTYTGENAESGRDQGHVQGTIAHLCETAEMAWSQGLDLYSEGNNIILKAMEYNAKYNLGFDVPYRPFGTCSQVYNSLSTMGRGQLSPVYEMVWNHYHNRRGLDAPYTGQARASYAPESSNGDHAGLGTLLYYRP